MKGTWLGYYIELEGAVFAPAMTTYKGAPMLRLTEVRCSNCVEYAKPCSVLNAQTYQNIAYRCASWSL